MAAEVDGTSKGLLGAFAVLTLGSGIATLVYGIFALLRYLTVEYNYGLFNLFVTSIVLIVIGGLLIIAVVLGVFGALKDVSNFRAVTVVLLFLLFVALAVIGVWAMVSFKTDRLQKSIDSDIERLSKEYKGLTAALQKKTDYLHRHYNCCVSSPSSSDPNAYDKGLPDSCCILPGCLTSSPSSEPRFFKDRCAGVYFQTKSKVVFHLAILTLAAAGATLIALIAYGLVFQRARAGYAAVSRG